jgi:uncharacterized delta-60 repeat protein
VANPGDVDSSFSGDGKRAIDFGGFDDARDVLIQSDGRIVVVGFGGAAAPSFCVARLRSGGALDPTFGSGGKRTIVFGGENESVFGAALQPDGKIVLAGDSDFRVAVARLNPNGSPDTTFGVGGKATVEFGAATFGFAVALAPSKRIVVAGQKTGADDFAVARLVG